MLKGGESQSLAKPWVVPRGLLMKRSRRSLARLTRFTDLGRISHNRIHMYLKAAGLAHDDPKKRKQRKWVRYKRVHSLSAVHIDWHESGWSDPNFSFIIDDASRMILAGGISICR